jgi:hypothetical protein
MRKENLLVMLWMLFGYFFIESIDAILNFIVHLIYFVIPKLNFSLKTMTILVPILTLALYVTTAFILIRRFNSKQFFIGDFPTEFPKKLFVGIVLIPILLNPITSKLSGLYGEYSINMVNYSTRDFLQFYGWMTSGVYISKWVVLIILAFVFLKKINILQHKNQTQ